MHSYLTILHLMIYIQCQLSNIYVLGQLYLYGVKALISVHGFNEINQWNLEIEDLKF